MLGKNWKTTVLGLCTILGAIIKVVMDFMNGVPVDFPVTIGAITAGVGLILAKDAGVIGAVK